MVSNSAVLEMILLGVTVKVGVECVCFHSAWKKMHSYWPSLDICTLLEVAIDGFINSFTKHKKICLMLLMYQVKTLTLMSTCGIKMCVICTWIYFLPQGRRAEKSLSFLFVCIRLHRNSR